MQPVRLFLLLFGVLTLAACGPVYIPSAVHMPMLERKGDVHLSGQLGSQGGQANGAYAVSDHLMLRATAQNSQTGDNYYRMGAVGMGFFSNLSSTDTGSGLRFAAATDLGGGISRGVFEFESTRRVLQGTFFRAAAQLDMGYELKAVSFGIATRAVYLHYQHDDESEAQESTADMLFGEPVAVFRVGTSVIKADVQAGAFFPIAEPKGDIGLPFPFIFSVGLSLDF